MDSIELFPASEGFLPIRILKKKRNVTAFKRRDFFMNLLKRMNFHHQTLDDIMIGEVEMGVNYVLIISTNAGLWGYNIGDTVQFTSLKPYRVIVSGQK